MRRASVSLMIRHVIGELGTAFGRLLDEVDRELGEAIELRERLHALAEPAHAEHGTVEALAERLEASGPRPIAGTGLFVRAGDAAEPAVVVRAELDALPIREETGAGFAARNGCMHACGHDVHMAALVALVRAVERLPDRHSPPLLALFQPSEEAYPSGARAVAEHADELGPVGAIVAAHVHPEVPWEALAVDAGVVNAAADNVAIVVTGSGGHAAYPHRGRDPVVALSHVVVALQQAISRRVDPMQSAVLSISVLRAGDTENVMPDRAEARGTLRTLQPDLRGALGSLVAEVARHAAAACGCEATVTFAEGEPAVRNDPGLAEGTRAFAQAAGFAPAAPLRSCGSDDFGYYSALAPSLLVFVGLKGAPGAVDLPLHHPGFLPPVASVRAVARAQAAAYMAAAATAGGER